MIQPRDFFDILPLLDNLPHPASATTLGDARLYVVSRQRMVEIVQRHPQVAGSLLPYLSKRLRDLAALTDDLAFTDVSTRLARLILVYARKEGEPTPHGIQLAWGLSHRQIAYLIGTAREVYNRPQQLGHVCSFWNSSKNCYCSAVNTCTSSTESPCVS